MEMSLIEAYRLYMAGTPIAIDMDRNCRFQKVGSMWTADRNYIIVNNEYRRQASDTYFVRLEG